MKTSFKKFLSPPSFEDESKNRASGLINIILLILIFIAGLTFLLADFSSSARNLIKVLSLSIFFFASGLKFLLYKGYLQIISILISLIIWTPFTALIHTFDGVRDTATTGYFLTILIASLLLNTELLALFTLFCSLSLAYAYWAEINGVLETSLGSLSSPIEIVGILLILNTTALLAGLTVHKIRQGETETRAERNKAQEYLNIACSIIITLDIDQKVTLINKMGCKVLGFNEDEILGKDWVSNFLPEDIREQIRADLAAYMAGNENRFSDSYENPIQTKNGQRRDIAWHNTLLRDNEGFIIGTLSSGEDITERILATRELEKRYLYLEGLLSSAPDAIVTMNSHNLIEEWNQGAEKLFGYTFDEVIGKGLDNLISSPELLNEAVSFTKTTMSGQEVPPTETVRYRKDGSAVDVILAGSPILIENELVGVVTVYTDISERKKMERELAHLATHDPLTNLPNRTLLQDRLEHALKRSARQKGDKRKANKWDIAVLMIDLDDFKEVNDSFGHAVGDLLLKAVARRLESVVRSTDTVARMGGDEFIVVFENISQKRDPIILVNKVLALFSEPFELDEHNISISASIGVSLYPKDGEYFENLSASADKAMYEAKRTKNSFRYFSEKENQ